MSSSSLLHRPIVVLPLLLLLLLACVVASLCIGEVPLTLHEVWRVLTSPIPESLEDSVLLQLRLPRTILGIAVGGSLSLAGAVLQGIYRNPLVEPYTLGISGGASLGVALVVSTGLHLVSVLLLPLAGFVGAMVTIFAVATLGLSRGRVSVQRMLLVGVMLSFISSSAVLFIMATTRTEQMNSIIFWTMGALNETDPLLVYGLLVIALLSLLLLYHYATPLNALRLGEEGAVHLGIDSPRMIRLLFVITSLLTGACIAISGVIGFVGLVMPQAMRLWGGSDYRWLLGASFLGGGSFLLLCDIVARSLLPYGQQLPIGVITGIIGGVAFIIILARSARSTIA